MRSIHFAACVLLLACLGLPIPATAQTADSDFIRLQSGQRLDGTVRIDGVHRYTLVLNGVRRIPLEDVRAFSIDGTAYRRHDAFEHTANGGRVAPVILQQVAATDSVEFYAEWSPRAFKRE